MKKSYLIAFLFIFFLGPIGFFYAGAATAFWMIATFVASIVFMEPLFAYIHNDLSGTTIGSYINAGIVLVEKQLIQLFAYVHIDLSGTTIGKYIDESIELLQDKIEIHNIALCILLLLLLYLLSMVLMPFYISKHNRQTEEARYYTLYSRIAAVEDNLKPKIPEKLQAPCLKCGSIISVRDKECTQCGTTKPFEDKEKILEYVENNFQAVYLSDDELKELSEELSFFSRVAHILSELEKMLGSQRKREEAIRAIKQGWQDLKNELDNKEVKRFVRKTFLYVVLGVLAITGASVLISLIFKTDTWILWVIIGMILDLVLFIFFAWYSISSYNLYKELFKHRREALHENASSNEKVGDEIKKRLMQFVNIFREKYRDDNELQEIIDRYQHKEKNLKDIYNLNNIRFAAMLKMILLACIAWMLAVTTIYSIEGASHSLVGGLFLFAVLAYLTYLSARSVWAMYYISVGYLHDIRMFNFTWGRYNINSILNYKEEL